MKTKNAEKKSEGESNIEKLIRENEEVRIIKEISLLRETTAINIAPYLPHKINYYQF